MGKKRQRIAGGIAGISAGAATYASGTADKARAIGQDAGFNAGVKATYIPNPPAGKGHYDSEVIQNLRDAGGEAGFYGSILVSAAAAYLLGKGAMWVYDRVKEGKPRAHSEKALRAAQQKLRTDKEFAAKARELASKKRQSMKEQYINEEEGVVASGSPKKKKEDDDDGGYLTVKDVAYGGVGGGFGITAGDHINRSYNVGQEQKLKGVIHDKHGDDADEVWAKYKEYKDEDKVDEIGKVYDTHGVGRPLSDLATNIIYSFSNLAGIAAGIALGLSVTYVVKELIKRGKSYQEAKKTVDAAQEKMRTDPKFAQEVRQIVVHKKQKAQKSRMRKMQESSEKHYKTMRSIERISIPSGIAALGAKAGEALTDRENQKRYDNLLDKARQSDTKEFDLVDTVKRMVADNPKDTAPYHAVSATPPLTDMEKYGTIGVSTLLGLAAGILLYKSIHAAYDKLRKQGKSHEQAMKDIEKAKQKLQTDPKFAAKAREMAQKKRMRREEVELEEKVDRSYINDLKNEPGAYKSKADLHNKTQAWKAHKDPNTYMWGALGATGQYLRSGDIGQSLAYGAALALLYGGINKAIQYFENRKYTREQAERAAKRLQTRMNNDPKFKAKVMAKAKAMKEEFELEEDLAFRRRMGKATARAGAIAGGVGGAALGGHAGSALGPVGAAVGAVGGAAVGAATVGAAGYVAGRINAKLGDRKKDDVDARRVPPPKAKTNIKPKRINEMRSPKEEMIIELAYAALLDNHAADFKTAIEEGISRKLTEKISDLTAVAVIKKFGIHESAGQEERWKKMHTDAGLPVMNPPYWEDYENAFNSVHQHLGHGRNTVGMEEVPDPLSTNELMKGNNVRGVVNYTNEAGNNSDYEK